MEAELIDGLCQRYSCLPSELMREDAHLLMRMHQILAMGRPEGADTSIKAGDSPSEQDLYNLPMQEMPEDFEWPATK